MPWSLRDPELGLVLGHVELLTEVDAGQFRPVRVLLEEPRLRWPSGHRSGIGLDPPFVALGEFQWRLARCVFRSVLQPEAAFLIDRPERRMPWVGRTEPTLDDLDTLAGACGAPVTLAA